jgi:uncharacterized heparinase superfamily protein
MIGPRRWRGFMFIRRSSVSQVEDGVVHLTAGDGESWAFVARDLSPKIEEDVHFADLAGAGQQADHARHSRLANAPRLTGS